MGNYVGRTAGHDTAAQIDITLVLQMLGAQSVEEPGVGTTVIVDVPGRSVGVEEEDVGGEGGVMGD